MSLCLRCGLCCDGTMFQVAPVTADEANALEGRVALSDDRTQLVQPCRALAGDLKCGVYAQRPRTCRAFRCTALAGLEAGRLSEDEANELIDELLERRRAVAVALGIDDVREAVRLARLEEKVPGTIPAAAAEAVSDALSRMRRGMLLMQMVPSDPEILRGEK